MITYQLPDDIDDVIRCAFFGVPLPPPRYGVLEGDPLCPTAYYWIRPLELKELDLPLAKAAHEEGV